MNKEIEEKLKAPFGEEDLEWRVQSSGVSASGKIWASVLVYISARAVQNRLDEVFGYDGWKTEYKCFGANSENIICKLSVWSEDKQEWISKEDGSSASNVDPFKGALSGALKRVASSGFGIGRYLYDYDNTFAEISEQKQTGPEWHRNKTKTGRYFYWKTPSLSSVKLKPNAIRKQNKTASISQPQQQSIQQGNINNSQLQLIQQTIKTKKIDKEKYTKILAELNLSKPLKQFTSSEADSLIGYLLKYKAV